MKTLIVTVAVVVFSASVSATNVSPHDQKDINGNDIKVHFSDNKLLENERLQRLHQTMNQYGMSEVGMEARRKMIGTPEGRAYHQALKEAKKNTAG